MLNQVKPGAHYGTGANHYISSLYDVALRHGLPVTDMLIDAGLREDMIHNPAERVPTEKLAEFQTAVWDAIDDESMGLSNRPLRRGTYAMMGKVSVHQPVLHKALSTGAKFYNLVTLHDFVTLEIVNDQAVLKVNEEAPEKDYQHLFAEMCLLAWHRYASWLISDILPLTETRFPYPPPNHIGEYHYLFPGVHKFNHKELALVFPAHYLERPVKQSESSLKAFMSRCPLELFRQYKADYSLATELKLMLGKAMLDGTGTIEHCADKLHMTRRTLIRKLKDEGTSFQQLKDIVRRDKSIFFLGQQGLKINEVAERVGYSDPAVFTRAFRQWTGLSPRDFRQQLLCGEVES